MSLPKRFERFLNDYPDVAKAYTNLGTAVHSSGRLEEKSRDLIKLAISVHAKLEGAVHSHYFDLPRFNSQGKAGKLDVTMNTTF